MWKDTVQRDNNQRLHLSVTDNGSAVRGDCWWWEGDGDLFGVLDDLGAGGEAFGGVDGSGVWFLGVDDEADSLVGAESHSSELGFTVELVVVHGWVGLDVGILATDGVDEAGGGSAVVVDGFAVEVLKKILSFALV